MPGKLRHTRAFREAVGIEFRILRIRKGVTSTQFAAALRRHLGEGTPGALLSQVSHVEHGRRDPAAGWPAWHKVLDEAARDVTRWKEALESVRTTLSEMSKEGASIRAAIGRLPDESAGLDPADASLGEEKREDGDEQPG